jgi:hypothetical protein
LSSRTTYPVQLKSLIPIYEDPRKVPILNTYQRFVLFVSDTQLRKVVEVSEI